MTVRSVDDLRAKIREVPDFPKPGILFYDITTLLKEAEAFRDVIDRMADQVKDARIDLVVGMESRGFIFAAPLAYKLGAGSQIYTTGPLGRKRRLAPGLGAANHAQATFNLRSEPRSEPLTVRG